MNTDATPQLLIVNQMAGPLTWELAEDASRALGPVALLTGHPDTLSKGSRNGVRVDRATAYDRKGNIRRVYSWCRYMLQAFIWLWRSPAGTPVLFFSNPPMLCWLGWLMHCVRGQPYAVMVHDIYPDILVKSGRVTDRNPIVRLWRWFNRKAYQRARLVMTLGEHMAANLRRQFDEQRTSAGRIHVVPPWADTESLRPLPKDQNWFAIENRQTDVLTVMYSGNMGEGHDLESLLEAARCLGSNPAIHFMLIGDGPKHQLVTRVVREQGLTNVSVLSWQPESVIPNSLATADIAVVSLEEEVAGLAVPSKAFSALAVGSALLVICGGKTELEDLVERHGCGWKVGSGATTQLCQILSEASRSPRLLAQMKARSRLAAEEFGSRKNSLEIVRCVQRYLISSGDSDADIQPSQRAA